MAPPPAAMAPLRLILICGFLGIAPAALAQSEQPPAEQPAAAQTEAEAAGEQSAKLSGAPLPRFAALRAPEVNMRTGPGTRYPIDWVYKRRNLPVEIVDEYDTWRRIRDFEGTAGWVHQSMLQSRRYIVISGEEGAVLRRDPQDDSRPVARLERGVIGRLESCGDIWCVVEIETMKGWLRRDRVFGVYLEEEIR